MTIQPAMQQVRIADLRPGMKHVNLVFRVVEIREEKNVISRYDGSHHRVAEIVVGDSSGIIIIPAWNDLIDRFEIGLQFQVKNGYTQLFENHLRLSIGRFGQLEDVDASLSSINFENDMSDTFHEDID